MSKCISPMLQWSSGIFSIQMTAVSHAAMLSQFTYLNTVSTCRASHVNTLLISCGYDKLMSELLVLFY